MGGKEDLMRADAAARRAKIVQSARQLFALRGEEVALDIVAHEANVGIATLYRNFPTREALAEEVTRSILTDIEHVAENASPGVAAGSQDAWVGFVQKLVDLNLGALSTALARYEAGELSGELLELQDAALERLETLISQAQHAGFVQQRISALELLLMIGLIVPPKSEAVRSHVPDFVANVTSVIIAGLAQRS